jgi:hypothetical protein
MSLFSSLKEAVVNQALKVAGDPRITKMVTDPRVMNAAMKAMTVGTSVKTNMDRCGRMAAGAFGLATQDEIDHLRTTIQTLKDQVATLETGASQRGPGDAAAR